MEEKSLGEGGATTPELDSRTVENGEHGRNGKLHQTLGFGAECSADK